MDFFLNIGNVYRTTFNFFNQPDNESMSSVSSEGGPSDNLLSFISSQLQDQSHPSTQSDSSSQQPNERNSSSRRDDDGNVEFDCD